MGTATVLLGPAVGVTDGDGLNPKFDDAPAHALMTAALAGILVEGGPTARWTDVSLNRRSTQHD